jgi:putative tricarboxylic transport membrane protein
MSNRRTDRITAVVFLLAGAFFVIQSRSFASASYGSGVGPDLFPMILGIALVLLSIRLFYETFHYQDEKRERENLDWKRFSIIVGSLLLYVVTLEIIGYVISTFLFLVISIQTMERGNWLKTLLVSAGFSIGVYYLYVQILEGTLPPLPIIGW